MVSSTGEGEIRVASNIHLSVLTFAPIIKAVIVGETLGSGQKREIEGTLARIK